MRTAAVLILCLAGCWRSQGPPRPTWPVLPAQIQESSGLARGARFGALWTHGDSGAAPVLYEVTAIGRLLRVVPVEGADAVDWEDVAPDGEGGLWIGDIGNNSNRRRNLTLYHVPAASLEGPGPARVDRVLRYAYPEQTGFPMPMARNFDAEALFVDDGVPHVLTKHRSDTRTVLYRIEPIDGEDRARAVKIAETDVGGGSQPFGGMVTAADLHPSGDWLAVLTYHAILIFGPPRSPDEHRLSHRVATIPLAQRITRQCEAISWDGTGLIMTNEEGVVFRIDDPLAPDRRFPDGDPVPDDTDGAG